MAVVNVRSVDNWSDAAYNIPRIVSNSLSLSVPLFLQSIKSNCSFLMQIIHSWFPGHDSSMWLSVPVFTKVLIPAWCCRTANLLGTIHDVWVPGVRATFFFCQLLQKRYKMDYPCLSIKHFLQLVLYKIWAIQLEFHLERLPYATLDGGLLEARTEPNGSVDALKACTVGFFMKERKEASM